MACSGRHLNEITSTGADGIVINVKDRSAAEHEIEFGCSLMAVRGHPVTGVMNLDEHAEIAQGLGMAVIGGIQKCEATVVVVAKAETLQLFWMDDAGQHRAGARLLPC